MRYPRFRYLFAFEVSYGGAATALTANGFAVLTVANEHGLSTQA